MPTATPHFPPEALTFLRALKRNNNREWFNERKSEYQVSLKAPLEAIVTQLDQDFRAFAPELVASPRVSIFRIYRDTRFSEDKSPYKTNVAAVFPQRGLPRHAGAGLYLEVSPGGTMFGGGIWAPSSAELRAIRAHIAGNLRRFRAIVDSPTFGRIAGPVEGDRLQRMPHGFPHDHPAAEYLKLKQFLAGSEHPAALATTARFYPTLLETFRCLAPFVRFLNEGIVK